MKREQLIKNGLKYQFKNEVTDDKHILTLSGIVAKPDLFDILFDNKTINARDIMEELDDVDKDIHIRINSGGGDGFEGIEIYNYIKNHPSHVTVEITALAASAASIIAMGGDKIIMNTGSQMMIHEASTIAWGNKTELYKAIDMLETADASLVDIYAERTGLGTEELNELLVKEKWFTADEAVAKGLADEKSSKKAEVPEGDEGTGAEPQGEPIAASAGSNDSRIGGLSVELKLEETEGYKEFMNEMSEVKRYLVNAGFVDEEGNAVEENKITNKKQESEAPKGLARFLI